MAYYEHSSTESVTFTVWTLDKRSEMTEILVNTTNELLADKVIQDACDAFIHERLFKTTTRLDSDSGLAADYSVYYNPSVTVNTEEIDIFEGVA